MNLEEFTERFGTLKAEGWIQLEDQLALYPGVSGRSDDPDDWTFNKAQTRRLTHCFHDYPARMIPQVAGKLLEMFGDGAKTLFDPYCGTGTSLVEGTIRGMKTIGTDINPLARLIAEAKTSTFNTESTLAEMHKFRKWTFKHRETNGELELPGIGNAEFWFKPPVAEKLGHIKKFINSIKDGKIRLFFQVAFSETVRESSNTRNGEFKLYRYDAEKLAEFNPDVFEIMTSKLRRNIKGATEFSAKLKQSGNGQSSHVYGFDTCVGIPDDACARESVDIVVTSPPYGDSSTTVAYGQYSRLSAAWLDLEEAARIDRNLMGGKKATGTKTFPCERLNEAIGQISNTDEKRALFVSAFYKDLQGSIANVGETIKPNGYACYVVGNRKVKGVTLPTDDAVKSFFEESGFEHVKTFTRDIPNKRMPSRNSPTNIKGAQDSTMTKEFVVVTRKK